MNVQVALDFNVQTGLLTVTFTSLDPLTGQAPTGVFDGFLPPDNSSGIGEGYVQYTVQPKAGLATGTTINQQASVVFDTNAAIAHRRGRQHHRRQRRRPAASAALPATTSTPSFTVSWSGSDGAAARASPTTTSTSPTTAARSRSGRSDTTATSATFTGQVGHTYGFYSVATDNVGLVQPTPTAAQATTRDVAPSPAVVQFAASQFAANVTGGGAQVVISRTGNLSASLTVTLSSPGGHDITAFAETVTIGPNVTSQIVTIPISNDGQPGESDTIIPLTLSSPGAGATLARPRPPASSSTTTTRSRRL